MCAANAVNNVLVNSTCFPWRAVSKGSFGMLAGECRATPGPFSCRWLEALPASHICSLQAGFSRHLGVDEHAQPMAKHGCEGEPRPLQWAGGEAGAVRGSPRSMKTAAGDTHRACPSCCSQLARHYAAADECCCHGSSAAMAPAGAAAAHWPEAHAHTGQQACPSYSLFQSHGQLCSACTYGFAQVSLAGALRRWLTG